MGIYFNFRSGDPRPSHIKNKKKMEELDKKLGNEGFEMVEEAQKLKEKFNKQEALESYGKDETRSCIIDGKTYHSVKKLEADLKLKKEVPEKETGTGDLWIDKKVAGKIGLSEPEYVSEAKFEEGFGIKLSELKKEKKERKLRAWKMLKKKLELEMDYEIKFHPERVHFVEGLLNA